MRIRGISYAGFGIHGHKGRSVPFASGYLKLGDYTGLVGRNDSGKSSLLRRIHESLRSKDRSARSTLVFAECNEKEFREISKHSLVDGPHAQQRPTMQSPRWWNGIDHDLTELESFAPTDSDSVIDAYAAYLTNVWGDDKTRGALALLLQAARHPQAPSAPGATAASHLLAFEPDALDGRPVLNVSWCLPEYESLSAELRDCLDKVSDGERLSRRNPFFPPEDHWDREDAPVPIAPLGSVALPLLPEPLMLPLPDTVVETEIADVITDCLWVFKHADALTEEGFAFEPHVYQSEVEYEREHEDPWILDEERAWRLNHRVADVCVLLEATAQTLLPPPIAERYQLLVRPGRPFRESSSRVEVLLREHDTGTPNAPDWRRGGAFEPASLAAGYQVWLQLALLEAASEVGRICVLARDRIAALEETINEIKEDEDNIDGESKFENSALYSEVENLREVLGSRSRLSSVSEPSRGAFDFALSRGHQDWSGFHRGKLLLLDEPERHLHPALQRELSSWLAGVLQRRSTQLIACTHSIPFMNVKGEYRVSYSYLSRAGQGNPKSVLEEFPPDQLVATDLIAQELGLNRGELLTMTRLLLWVEGPMDEAVLEGYFGSENLRERGFSILLLTGAVHTARILEASLLRFTDAEVAVWLDKIAPDFADRLIRDSGWAREQTHAADTTDEQKHLAKVVCEAENFGRVIHPIGIHPPVDDIFDLLDEGVVIEEWPDFPGHGAALKAFKAANLSAGMRKNFYEKKFGVRSTPESYRMIAHRMRMNGIQAERLDGIVSRCEELTT